MSPPSSSSPSAETFMLDEVLSSSSSSSSVFDQQQQQQHQHEEIIMMDDNNINNNNRKNRSPLGSSMRRIIVSTTPRLNMKDKAIMDNDSPTFFTTKTTTTTMRHCIAAVASTTSPQQQQQKQTLPPQLLPPQLILLHGASSSTITDATQEEVAETTSLLMQQQQQQDSGSCGGGRVQWDNKNNDNDDNYNDNDPQRPQRVLYNMRKLTSIAAIGGFLSGYNTGVISGALLPLTRVFDLQDWQEESIVSATILFAMLASLFGSSFNERWGRKPMIMLAAAIFTLGGLIMMSAQGFAYLVLGQVVLGIGIGMESLTSPLYISEVAKPNMRGTLVSAYGLLMCFGQFTAGIVDGIFGAMDGGWRFMFGLSCLPGMVLLLGFVSLPESPAWLYKAGRTQDAGKVLESVRDSSREVHEELHAIQESITTCRNHASDESVTSTADSTGGTSQSSATTWSSVSLGGGGNSNNHSNNNNTAGSLSGMLRHASTRRALLVGCSLMVLQQFCGANVVMYYSATIYRLSGFAELTAIWLSAFTALAQLVGLAISIRCVESVGRRPLVLTSLSLVTVCLVGMGLSFHWARVTSEPVTIIPTNADLCQQQPALVWNGITQYCYDCSLIEGCGFCGGACVPGNAAGPFDPSQCPSSSDESDWEYNICTTPTIVGYMPVFWMVLYLIVFGVGIAGLPWTINSEIYPIQYRSLAVSISTGTNWLCNLLISSTFLSLSNPAALTIAGSFGLYAVISGFGVVWLYWALPETKGLNLEQMDQAFRPHVVNIPPPPNHHQAEDDDDNKCSQHWEEQSPLWNHDRCHDMSGDGGGVHKGYYGTIAV